MGCSYLCVVMQAQSLGCNPTVTAPVSVSFLSRSSLPFSPKSFFMEHFQCKPLVVSLCLAALPMKCQSSLPFSGCPSHALSCQALCHLQKTSWNCWVIEVGNCLQTRQSPAFNPTPRSNPEQELLSTTVQKVLEIIQNFQWDMIPCTLPVGLRLLYYSVSIIQPKEVRN